MIETDLQLELIRLRRRIDRERRARQEAEALAERGTRLLYERAQQMQLLYKIADACRSADSAQEAIGVVLDEVCAYTGWPIGHAYLVTDDCNFPLASTRFWHLDHPEVFAAFRDVTERSRFRLGEGLPGRVLETGRSVWINDVTQIDSFPRAPYASRCGVRGGFAIPVIAGRSVVAVLEFFSVEAADPEESWIEVTAQIGIQVGRTFEREARDEADRANRAKSEFLSRMSHELRTPLNAILGFGQLLEMDSLTRDQRESVRHVLKGGRHLLNLVNEVLDISRIEAGQMHLSPEPVRVLDVLEESLEMIGPLAAQRQIPVYRASDLPGDRHIKADRQRLKQVLLNLLSNAIKYNRPGGTVSVTCVEAEGTLRFNVSDTGAGIPAHQLQQLFTPFERLSAEQSSVEGTGLGLALSKRLAELMGGKMGVESTPGKGSTFWVELEITPGPIELSAVAVPTAPTPHPAQGPLRTILYVEDNLSNLELVERLFARRPDFKLLAAMHAGLGVDLAIQHVPDLILLDLNLPDMTGHEALLHLQGNALTSGIPVIIISADATAGQSQRLLAAGAVAYLTKPLDVQEFLCTVDRTLNSLPQSDSDNLSCAAALG